MKCTLARQERERKQVSRVQSCTWRCCSRTKRSRFANDRFAASTAANASGCGGCGGEASGTFAVAVEVLSDAVEHCWAFHRVAASAVVLLGGVTRQTKTCAGGCSVSGLLLVLAGLWLDFS